MNKILILCLSIVGVIFHSKSQVGSEKKWKTVPCEKSELSANYQNVIKYDVLAVDNAAFKKQLNDKQTTLVTIPISSTESETFEVSNSNVMPAELAAKFPNIYSFSGKSITDPKRHLKLDINSSGFHALISDGTERIFIDPIKQGDNRSIIYSDKDFEPSDEKVLMGKKAKCTHHNVIHNNYSGGPIFLDEAPTSQRKGKTANRSTDGFLYTYRLALACTGEYGEYHGGTKESVMSAMVTSINRVNEVYNRDLSVKLELIPNNDLLIFLDPDTDGFTNTDVFLDELSFRINDIIGEQNYDLSHGFSTDAGGVAYFASVCFKDSFSGGVTGIRNPEGDVFDIDFVAHELGHQFAGEHVFNGTRSSCSGNSSTMNFEPGSGSTIMGYAGICGADNLQNNTDPYFNGGSLDAMITFIQEDATCATKIATGNNLPSIAIVSPTNLTIPISTPFALEGLSIDEDDDEVTYCWEQNDSGGESGAPDQQAGDAPIFRSYNPTTDPVRYFPKTSDLLNGTSTLGEMLPEYTRELNFKLTIRDNYVNGGGVVDKNYKIDVSGESGPFVVTSQDESNTSVEVGELITVTWDVANTDVSPVNCSQVEIYLSTNGGDDFDVLLATTSNDGSHELEIPNEITTAARIKVKAVDNVFFNVNAADFSIVTPTVSSFSLSASIDESNICGTNTSLITITSTSFLGFSDVINLTYELPTGLILDNAPAAMEADGSLSFDASLGASSINGAHTIVINANSGNISTTVSINVITVSSVENEIIMVNEPIDQTIINTLSPSLAWEENPIISTYNIVMSESLDLSNLILDVTEVRESYSVPFSLDAESNYYWQIEGTDVCGNKISSDVLAFATPKVICETFVSDDVPVDLPDFYSSFESFLDVELDEKIVDLNVTLQGTHQYTDDLLFYLESDSEDDNSVYLFGAVCSGGVGEDFNLTLDDESSLGGPPCVPVDGRAYTPEESLSHFNGQSAEGTWRLLIIDAFDDIDEGVLESWEVEFCYADLLTSVFSVSSEDRLNVFPNPTTGAVSLESETNWVLINSYGNELDTGYGDKLDLTSYASGVYLLKTPSGNVRIIKSK